MFSDLPRIFSLGLATTLLASISIAQSASTPVFSGPLRYVVCTSGSSLNVRDQSLKRILFTVPAYSEAKPMQSFAPGWLEKEINGVLYTFVKVQFPDRMSTENVGWISEDFLKVRSQCPQAVTDSNLSPAPSRLQWSFPTVERPTHSYKTGMRRFGSSRDGGQRLHAAGDLYRVDDEPVLSISAGQILRDRYYFYQGTYAIEVLHREGQVVRYGEIKGRKPPRLSGSLVSAGQPLGFIGTVNSGCCLPMLHFEMYSGSEKGPLTQSGTAFNRRKDLMDPTAFLGLREKEKFGVSY